MSEPQSAGTMAPMAAETNSETWNKNPPISANIAVIDGGEEQNGAIEVSPGGTLRLRVYGVDKDTRLTPLPETEVKDQLAFTWLGSGRFSAVSGNIPMDTNTVEVDWTAPDEPGTYRVRVKVNDLYEGSRHPRNDNLVYVPAEGEPGLAITVVRPRLTERRVKSIDFSGEGYKPILLDSGSGSYDAPHWLDADGDGDAQNGVNGDRRYPVLYRSSTKIVASVTFVVEPEIPDADWRVWAITSDPNIKFARVAASQSGRFLTATVTSTVLPSRAKFHDPLIIDWKISTDGGQTSYAAGSSGCPIYVSYGESQTSQLFLTVVHAGIAGAEGVTYGSNAYTNKDNIIRSIWSNMFAGAIPGMKTHANPPGTDQPLTYWQTDAPVGGASTAGLVRYLDGRCGAWQHIMTDAVRVHNVPAWLTGGVREYGTVITEQGIVPNRSVLGSNVLGFRVYQRLPGQNNSDPHYEFLDHAVVRFENSVFDPSYGLVHHPTTGTGDATYWASARLAWEDASIAWFAFPDTSGGVIVQPDKKGIREVTFTP